MVSPSWPPLQPRPWPAFRLSHTSGAPEGWPRVHPDNLTDTLKGSIMTRHPVNGTNRRPRLIHRWRFIVVGSSLMKDINSPKAARGEHFPKQPDRQTLGRRYGAGQGYCFNTGPQQSIPRTRRINVIRNVPRLMSDHRRHRGPINASVPCDCDETSTE